MNKQPVFTSASTTLKRSLIAILALISVSLHGQSGNKEDPATGSAVVEYLGSDQEMLLFNVHYKNVKGERFTVEINDNSDNILFKEIYRDKEFNKKFKIPKDLTKVNFVIKSMKDKSLQAFHVNSISRTYEDVVVKRVSE